MTAKKSKPRGSVGMPAALHLADFGEQVCAAFDGACAYQVGSSLTEKVWRDVDVALILTDEQYEAMGFGKPDSPWNSKKWIALVLAFNALGRQMTGLPIDFKIQQQTWANKTFDRERNALFAPWRYCERPHKEAL